MINNRSSQSSHIVGIVTSQGKNSPIVGNLQLFRELSEKLATKGGKILVFSPSDLIDGVIKGGYVYHKRKKKWIYQDYEGIPSVIYNRIPYRKNEDTASFKGFSKWCSKKGVPLFNGCFFKKWDIYTIIGKDIHLSSHLPFTVLLQSKEQVENLLSSEYPSLYLKPNTGSKGNGIFILSKLDNGTFQMKGHHGTYGSFDFQNVWERKIEPLLKTKAYLVQKKIALSKYNRCPFDYRIFAHHVNNRWIVSGIGVRQSKTNGVTTHVLRGGRIINVLDVCEPSDFKVINDITIRCGIALQRAYAPHLIKEFSIDIGKSMDGHFYIFDVNSKPMKFDEPEIYEQGLNHLIDIFLEYRS